MLPILYTNTDSLRSMLGLDDEDLSDSELIARNLEKELVMDLATWCSNHASITESVYSGTATQTQSDIADALSLYSSYFCAKLVIPSLQLAASQSVSDGKNALNRYSAIDFDKLYDRIAERVAFYKKYIVDLNTEIVVETIAASVKFFSLAGSGYDPVTG